MKFSPSLILFIKCFDNSNPALDRDRGQIS